LIAVDASVIVAALGNDGREGIVARDRLIGEEMFAPHLIDLEAVSAWRRLVSIGQLDEQRATLALFRLGNLALRRVPHGPLLARCWELRGNVTVYDASYVALAEQRGISLVTADRRLARAPGIRCPVEVLA